MAQIRSHFKNKYVKILTCFFAIALILFTSFSNLFIPIFAADDPTDNPNPVFVLKAGTYRFNDVVILSQDFNGISQNINFTLDFESDGINALATCDQIVIYGTGIGGDGSGQEWYKISVNILSLVPDLLASYGVTYPYSMPIYSYYVESGNATWSFGNALMTIPFDTVVDSTFGTWYIANTNYNDVNGDSLDYGDLVLGQTRVFKQNPAPVANMLVSDQFSFTDANGNTYNEFIAANMLTDGNPLLYIKYGDVYAYGSKDQSLVLLRTWNQPYYRQITFNELPDDQATIDYILANSTAVSEPDVPLDPDDPYNSGYNVGYDVGYQAGLQQGYDNGYNAGFADGDYQNGYQAGYEKGTSNTFVKSLFVNFFTGIVEAIDSIVLFEEDGITFTMWDIMVALIVISIIITILVVYRGG